MSVVWSDLTIRASGETVFDGEAIADPVDPFSAAITIAQGTARSVGMPLLVRVTDEGAGGEPTWIQIDEAGAVSTAAAPADMSDALSPAPSISGVIPTDVTEAPQPFAPPRTVSSRRTRFGKPIIVGTVCTLGAVLLAGAVWGGWALMNTATAAASRPVQSVSATPSAASVVTLPGFATDAAWSTRDVEAVAAVANRVITASGATLSVRDARSGSVIATADFAGELDLTAGYVEGSPALAATSDTQALVWVGEAVDPVAIDLTGGRRLTTRTGTLMVVGTDRSFEVVTATGTAPVTAPRPEMIVLGIVDGTVLWAGAPHQIVSASPNGTALREITLVAPEASASITPKVGWVRAATGASVVVGWTLPDGSTATGVHSTATGELVAEISGAGDGFLSPDATSWMVDGHLVDLASSSVSKLPDGFVASRFLGDGLYGAIATGEDALLPAGESTAKRVGTLSIRPFAITDKTLLTLTAGVLAAFPEAS